MGEELTPLILLASTSPNSINRNSGAPEKLRRATGARNITADIKVYPKAGHSFANQLPAQPLLRVPGFGYDEAATADAWSRVFAFFDEHLRT